MDMTRDALLNAVTGSLVTIIVVFLPLSSILGGAVAGYLQGESHADGAMAGGLSGLIATVPLFLMLLFVVPLFVFAPFGVVTLPISPLTFAAVLLVALLIYTPATSTLGGIVGAYLSESSST